MKKTLLLLLPAACLALAACEQKEPKRDTNPQPKSSYTSDAKDATSDDEDNQAPTPEDQQLTQKVQKALSDDSTLAPAVKKITISADSGEITLEGTVETAKQKQDIESKVKQIDGVKDVDNELEIAGS